MQKHATHKSNNTTLNTAQLAKLLTEAVILFMMTVSIYLFVSLITYHKADGGWSHTGYSVITNNFGGNAGAWLADILLYLFGYLAFLFPIAIFYFGIRLYLTLDSNLPEIKLIAFRGLGFIQILISSCGLVSLFISRPTAFLPFSSGGILGNVLGESIFAFLGNFGSFLVLFAVFLIGLTWLFDLSWFKVFEKLSEIMKIYLLAAVKTSINKIKKIKLAPDSITKDKIQPVGKNKSLFVQKSDNMMAAEKKRIGNIRKNDKAFVSKTPPVLGLGSLPAITLLDSKKVNEKLSVSALKLEDMSREVEQKLLDFGIEVQVVSVHPGPVITRFELQLAPGIKASKITALAKDLARSLSVVGVRVVEVIPGKTVVGLEIPNDDRESVLLSEVLASEQFKNSNAALGIALGKDISGHPVIVDLAKMPHLLVAGTTGAGKSVGINAMLLSLLFKLTPEQVRLILVDPKMLELSIYQDIPHLLAPVVTDMREAASALRWCVAEMERRYKLMAEFGVRNITGYNKVLQEQINNKKNRQVQNSEESLQETNILHNPLPYIVIVIDEFADMMMVVGKKVEVLIARLAQKARAAGIHMILATQRPSVDVITGLIKSNIPTRISFQVSSKIDSRTILDQQGAEQLLGYGDMLYLPPGTGTPVRVHGAFVGDHEVHNVTSDWKKRGEPQYEEEVINFQNSNNESSIDTFSDDSKDEYYNEAVNFVKETKRVSVSSIQRKFKIGYNRAARIVEDMEKEGIVSTMETNGTREILV